MEAGIIILILLLGVLIAGIIAAFVSQGKGSDRSAGYGPGPGGLTSTMRSPTDSMGASSASRGAYTPPETATNQVTICTYRPTGPVRLCPICDGENPPAAAHCHICGRSLR